MADYHLYVVDDEKALARGIALNLAPKYRVSVFHGGAEALAALEVDPPDLVLLDIRMPGLSGLQTLEGIKGRNPDIQAIMVTAFEETQTVITAMKLGAYDYVVKPLQMDLLELTIEKALESIRLRKEVRDLQQKALRENMPLFLGQSRAIQDVMQVVKSVAKSPDTPVMILGESGTGKELVASAIHYHSPNFRGPFVQVNCAAIPENLIESELFGYVKGAFSGAAGAGKKGLVEEAEGGTLFLDEVGDLCLDAQAKLLRFLDSGEFYRVGSTKKITARTRIVSATNKDIAAMIRSGSFREDFYYRIGVVKVEVPSLNDRRSDIPAMARQFAMEFAQKFKKPVHGFSPAAEEALSGYRYQGNIRELKNIIERAVLVEPGPVLDIPELTQALGRPEPGPAVPPEGPPPIPPEGLDLDALLRTIEKRYIDEALVITGQNEAIAAKLLGIKYTTLRYRRRR